MKLALIIGTALATLALGVSSAMAGGSATLDMHANGIWCKPMSGGAGCVAMDGSRYGVAIHKNFVFVYDSDSGRIVFKRYH
jgi:hypothetical protein